MDPDHGSESGTYASDLTLKKEKVIDTLKSWMALVVFST
jgi:hypothetical protein